MDHPPSFRICPLPSALCHPVLFYSIVLCHATPRDMPFEWSHTHACCSHASTTPFFVAGWSCCCPCSRPFVGVLTVSRSFARSVCHLPTAPPPLPPSFLSSSLPLARVYHRACPCTSTPSYTSSYLDRNLGSHDAAVDFCRQRRLALCGCLALPGICPVSFLFPSNPPGHTSTIVCSFPFPMSIL